MIDIQNQAGSGTVSAQDSSISESTDATSVKKEYHLHEKRVKNGGKGPGIKHSYRVAGTVCTRPHVAEAHVDSNTSSYLTVAQSRKFHHHTERHHHRRHQHAGKAGAHYRNYSVPGTQFVDCFPFPVEIHAGVSRKKLSAAQIKQDVSASELKDSLFWVRGTLDAMGAPLKAIYNFMGLTHCLADGGLSTCSADIMHSKYDVSSVGDVATQVLFDKVQDTACHTGQETSEKCLESSWVRAAFGDIIGEVARQRKIGQCSGNADWSSLDMSNPVSRVFKEFAVALDAQAKSKDVFSWREPGKIFYRALASLPAHSNLNDLKQATIYSAIGLYPDSQMACVLKNAWDKIEGEMTNTAFMLDGKPVQSVTLARQGGFTGLTEQTVLDTQALKGSLAEWLSDLPPDSVKLPKGAADVPVCRVVLKLTDGSQAVRYYNPMQLPQEVQALLETAEWGVVPKE